MPLRRKRPWQTIRAAFLCVCFAGFLVRQTAFCLDNITETIADFRDFGNGSTNCNGPGGILHGHLEDGLNGSAYFANGTELQFICDSDYVLILGDGRMACMEGTWVPSNKPLCIPYRPSPETSNGTHCSPPPFSPFSILDTLRSYGKYDAGSTVIYHCQLGYELVGPSLLACGDDGQWHPDIVPRCKLVYTWLKDVANGSAAPGASDTPALRSDTTSVMKILSYLAVPVLVGFVIAVLLNLKHHQCLQLKSRTPRTDGPPDGTPGPRSMPFNHSNTVTLSPANFQLASQRYLQRLRPPSSHYGQYPYVFNLSSRVPDMGLPTYEEAIKDSSPPSFDVACGLGASTPTPSSGQEIAGVTATTEPTRPGAAI